MTKKLKLRLFIASLILIAASWYLKLRLYTVFEQPQNDGKIQMADGFYQSGKIYVVIGVIVIIFIGMLIYLVSIDNKVSKLEKEIKNK